MKQKQAAIRILFFLFIASFVTYIAIFATAFSNLPLNIPPWHQSLLLFFHFIPMFFLQLLLSVRATWRWKLWSLLLLLGVPGLVFLSFVEWDILGLILFLFWCIAPMLGAALAEIIWQIFRRLKHFA